MIQGGYTMVEILTSSKNMSREDWLEWRKKGIGGSDVSIICGINKYKSTLELWMEKTGKKEQEEAGESAYWGNIMEPIIREEFSKRSGLKVDTINSILRHNDYDFMLANVDGVVTDVDNTKCIFEAKTASAYKKEQWENSIPEEYMLQIQHYMSVTGYKKTYISALIGGNSFVYKCIERDDELIDMIITLEKQFWYCVINDTPPSIDGSEACTNLMSKLYPTADPNKTITLSTDADILINQYNEAKYQEEIYSSLKDEAINKLKNMLGDNEIGLTQNNIISWKNILTERLDSKRLRLELPEIYSSYLSSSSSRRFNIKLKEA